MGIQNALINTVRKKGSLRAHKYEDDKKETLNINFSNIFFKSYTFDDKDHPIYIFDSTYLPNMSNISNDTQLYDSILDKLVQKLIQKLPKNKKFSLIIFSSGFKNLNWKWTMSIKIYAKIINDINNYRLENQDKLIIHKMYIVHESLWVRTLFQIWRQFKAGQALNKKETEKDANDSFVLDEEEDTYKNVLSSTIFETIYLNDLSELAQCVDITKLRISLNVYFYDLKINDCIELPSSYYQSMSTQTGDKLNRDYRQTMFEKIYERLTKESVKNELVFYKQGDKQKSNIMIEIINRNNYCDISQWDIYSLATVFIWFLSNKKKIFFPMEIIKSCKDITKYITTDDKFETARLGFTSTFEVFKKMMEYHCYYNLVKFIIPVFMKMIKHYGQTRHTYETVTEVLVGPFCKPNIHAESYQIDKKLGKIFIANVLAHFDDIVDQYEQLESDSKNKDDENDKVEVKANKIFTEKTKQQTENRPVPHLSNLNVSKQISRNEVIIPTKVTPLKKAPKLPNPRKSSSTFSPSKSVTLQNDNDQLNSPTKRKVGGASTNKELLHQKPPLIPFALNENFVFSDLSNINTSFYSDNDDTKYSSLQPATNSEESRNNSETLYSYSDESSVQTPVKKLSPPPVFTKPSKLRSQKLESPKLQPSNNDGLYSYSNIVLSPVKIRDFPALKTTSRNLSLDIQNASIENNIINGHGNNEDVWEYVITKKENNKLIKDINSYKDFEMQLSSKQNKKSTDYVGSVDPKLTKNRKVSNLIMLFEERSEGYNMMKDLKKNELSRQ
ncbi:hypothetical protein QEN19_002879 [Hanseniaspora menglaensis]